MPTAGLLLDPSGNLFGTTPYGGADDQNQQGAVFEIIAASPSSSVLLSPTSLYFGDVSIGSTSSAETVTVTNSGSADLTFPASAATIAGPNRTDFSIGSDSCSGTTLVHSNICSVSVKFTPSAPASESASLNLADNASDSPQGLALSGTGVGGVVSLAPLTGLTFASQMVGTESGPQTITLSNTGNATLHIMGIDITGANNADFSETSTCGSSLLSGSSCAVSVIFTPTIPGARVASVSIVDDAAGSPHSLPLTGTGAAATAPAITLSPTSLTFASQAVGSASAAQAVVLTNSGTAALNVNEITIVGTHSGDFSQTNTCGSSVEPGDSCIINVTFTPTAAGMRTASVSIADNAIGSPHGLLLSGTGESATTPAITLSPTSLTFNSQAVGSTSAAQTILLTNSGTAQLSISGITIAGSHSGDYNQTNNCGSIVAAGSNCTISVTFTPTNTGTRTASISIADSASGSPHNMSLTATGAVAAQSDFSVAASPASITLTAGSSGTTTMTVTPANGFNTAVSFSCSGLPSLSMCSFSPATVTPVSGAVTTKLSVSTTATTTSRLLVPERPGTKGARTVLALAGLFVCLLPLGKARRRGLRLLSVLAFTVVIGVFAGCGGQSHHSTNPGTPAGTYTVTVSATSGSGNSALTHSTTFSLTVQ